MEGIYFFGEHVRWNLGWENPNQAGAFIATLIPGMWGLWLLAAGGKLRVWGIGIILLCTELFLWFLLCKTFSRGALVAVALSSVVYFLWKRFVLKQEGSIKRGLARVVGIVFLLFVTGFFARIDPSFISQDASAGNRLTLWKGGMQMIAVAPLQGWGKGQSGIGFMHWFQALEAKEGYAGMVNSFLHIGVEYGLPILAIVVALGLTLVVVSLIVPWLAKDSARKVRFSCSICMAAGASILTFLIANVFSTLWIFNNLWWVPGFSSLFVVSSGFIVLGRRFLKVGGSVLGVSTFVALIGALGLFLTGRSISGEPRLILDSAGTVTLQSKRNRGDDFMLVFPESSVLGENWGKEIRRLAIAREFRDMKIRVSRGSYASEVPRLSRVPKLIIACGAEAAAGFKALSNFPEATLILVHPLGKAGAVGTAGGKVIVLLPMLDVRGEGRSWRLICKERGWSYTTSPGVGQDVRLIWPDVLVKALDHTFD